MDTINVSHLSSFRSHLSKVLESSAENLNGHQYERMKCVMRNIQGLIDETNWDDNGNALPTEAKEL